MMSMLPPSPAASPTPDGNITRQKGSDSIEFLHTSANHLSHPPSPQTSTNRDDPSAPTSPDFSPRVDGDGSRVFTNTPPCSDPASPDVVGANCPPGKHRSHHRPSSEKRSFPRISRPVELMRNSYDYVVIGSGYGGAVAASRLARSVGPEGRNSVCVLERGMERWPGEYPSTAVEGLKNLYISGEFAPGESKGTSVDKGDPEGMYRLILGKGLSAVVGSGEYKAYPRVDDC